MKILAIDTATKVAGAAVVNEHGILAESWLNTGKTHSQRLLPLIDDMLKNGGITLEEIDGFAVTVGPGSFTGLRIGISTIKAFAQALNKQIVEVVSLDALSRNMSGFTGIICPILDARKNEVYNAIYHGEINGIHRISPYRAIDPCELIEELKEKEESIIFLGDAVPVYKNLILEKLGDKVSFAPPSKNLLRASEVAGIGLEKFNNGDVIDLHTVKPLYLRASEAEIKWEQAHGRCCS